MIDDILNELSSNGEVEIFFDADPPAMIYKKTILISNVIFTGNPNAVVPGFSFSIQFKNPSSFILDTSRVLDEAIFQSLKQMLPDLYFQYDTLKDIGSPVLIEISSARGEDRTDDSFNLVDDKISYKVLSEREATRLRAKFSLSTN